MEINNIGQPGGIGAGHITVMSPPAPRLPSSDSGSEEGCTPNGICIPH
jgi:hypothetical protein